MSAFITTTTNVQTLSAATTAELDTAVLAALTTDTLLYGNPFVFGANVCQMLVTKTTVPTEDTIATLKAQGVQEALNAGTVITPQEKAAADAQAVAEAIAAGIVVPVNP